MGGCRRDVSHPVPSAGHGHFFRVKLDLELSVCPSRLSECRSAANPQYSISFFTPFITSAIDFRYGYVFAACCFTGAAVVYFFLCEHQGRTLEEIDTMYITHVSPRKSSKWQPPEGEELVTADNLYLEPGARGIRKADAAGMETMEKREDLPAADQYQGVHDVSGTGFEPEATGVRGGSIS